MATDTHLGVEEDDLRLASWLDVHRASVLVLEAEGGDLVPLLNRSGDNDQPLPGGAIHGELGELHRR